MPSQSENKPYPVRLEPALRERVKNAGGSRLVRRLIRIFFGEKATRIDELGWVEEDLAKLEALPLKDLDLSDLEFLSESVMSVLRYSKGNRLLQHQGFCLLGRVEWLKALKTKKVRTRWTR